MKNVLKKGLSLLLAITIIFSSAYVGLSEVDFGGLGIQVSAKTNYGEEAAVAWIKARGNENWWRDVDSAYGCQCVDLVMAYYDYLLGYHVSGHARDYLSTSKLPSGWYMDSTPTPGSVIVWGGNTWTGQWTTGEYGHVGLVYSVSGSNVYTVETNTGSTNGVGAAAGAKFRTRVNVGAKYIHPDFTPSTPLKTPTITFNQSSYTAGDTITVSWIASPSDSNLSHYWISVCNPDGNLVINERIDKSNTSYSFTTPGVGTYAVTISATPYGSVSGEGSLTDTKSITINAKTSTYTILYDANGGTGGPGAYSCTSGTEHTIPSKLPERFGYNFMGWGIERDAISLLIPGNKWTVTENITFYAQWISSLGLEIGDFKSKINYAGGYWIYLFEPYVTTKYIFESTGTVDSKITIYDSDGNELATDDDSGTDRNFLLDYTLKYGETYYVKVYAYGDNTGDIPFTVNGISCISYNLNYGNDMPYVQEAYIGEKATLSSTIPVREGYKFLGWARYPEATEPTYQPGVSVNISFDDLMLYAVWEQLHVHDYIYSITKVATCTTDGLGTYTCECGDEYTEEILATGHLDTTYVTEQEPTCSEDGFKDEYCLDCGELIGTESIPATGHLTTTWIIEQEPTCTEDGYKDEWCLDCGAVVNTEIIPANGHSEGEWTVDAEPTCTEEGSKHKLCSVCNELVTEVIPAMGHSHSTEWTVDVVPTCTEEGSKSHHCTGCDEMVTDVTVVAALGHDYKLVSIAEEHPHTNTFTCSRCPDTKTEVSFSDKCGACNFSYTDVDSATCRITGYIGGKNTFVIPTTINGKTVTTTTTGAFKNNTTLTSVKIEDGVQGLGALAFLGCSALSKVVIPESVTSIGANAFYNCASDFTIYCFRDSYAMQYAIDNSLNYVVMDIGETDNCTIDYDDELIFISIEGLTSIDDILYIPTDSMAFAEASLISGANEFLGTGSVVTVFDGNDISSEYTLIVEGDTNGDSVCDALDAAQVALVSNGQKTIDGAYQMAADSNSDDIVDIEDYQAIVNQVVA